MDGKTYPARLVDLPCVVETQKTLDRRTFFKSGDVGQMLIVYKVNRRVNRKIRAVRWDWKGGRGG